jgi:predicted O-methyltransferase YrrM
MGESNGAKRFRAEPEEKRLQLEHTSPVALEVEILRVADAVDALDDEGSASCQNPRGSGSRQFRQHKCQNLRKLSGESGPGRAHVRTAPADGTWGAVRMRDECGGASTGPSACLDEVGSFLRTLAASLPSGRVGEVGTGAGVGTAWLASGLATGASLTTVELEPRLAAAARGLFVDRADVEVLTGDWLEVMPQRGPFDLLFLDGGGHEALHPANWQSLAELLKPSGIMILDDLTPEEAWPDSWRGKPDPKRELAFNSGLFTATEIQSRAHSSLLMLVRKGKAS